jgi:RNA polymerase sigma-70 factor (ECF subfamily)
MNDNELVSQVLSGEEDAYAEILRHHHAWVMGLCRSTLNDQELAEDAAQEIFLKAYRALSQFKKTSSFSTWLYRIASNHCLDLLRHRSRQKTQSLDELMEREGGSLHRLVTSPENQARSQEDADLVQRTLDCLSPEYRLILTLRETQGLSYQELAETLGCSLDAVKARLQRARKDFKDRLRHFSGCANV